jgi:hypothetical protein
LGGAWHPQACCSFLYLCIIKLPVMIIRPVIFYFETLTFIR